MIGKPFRLASRPTPSLSPLPAENTNSGAFAWPWRRSSTHRIAGRTRASRYRRPFALSGMGLPLGMTKPFETLITRAPSSTALRIRIIVLRSPSLRSSVVNDGDITVTSEIVLDRSQRRRSDFHMTPVELESLLPLAARIDATALPCSLRGLISPSYEAA